MAGTPTSNQLVGRVSPPPDALATAGNLEYTDILTGRTFTSYFPAGSTTAAWREGSGGGGLKDISWFQTLPDLSDANVAASYPAGDVAYQVSDGTIYRAVEKISDHSIQGILTRDRFVSGRGTEHFVGTAISNALVFPPTGRNSWVFNPNITTPSGTGVAVPGVGYEVPATADEETAPSTVRFAGNSATPTNIPTPTATGQFAFDTVNDQFYTSIETSTGVYVFSPTTGADALGRRRYLQVAVPVELYLAAKLRVDPSATNAIETSDRFTMEAAGFSVGITPNAVVTAEFEMKPIGENFPEVEGGIQYRLFQAEVHDDGNLKDNNFALYQGMIDQLVTYTFEYGSSVATVDSKVFDFRTINRYWQQNYGQLPRSNAEAIDVLGDESTDLDQRVHALETVPPPENLGPDDVEHIVSVLPSLTTANNDKFAFLTDFVPNPNAALLNPVLRNLGSALGFNSTNNRYPIGEMNPFNNFYYRGLYKKAQLKREHTVTAVFGRETIQGVTYQGVSMGKHFGSPYPTIGRVVTNVGGNAFLGLLQVPKSAGVVQEFLIVSEAWYYSILRDRNTSLFLENGGIIGDAANNIGDMAAPTTGIAVATNPWLFDPENVLHPDLIVTISNTRDAGLQTPPVTGQTPLTNIPYDNVGLRVRLNDGVNGDQTYRVFEALSQTPTFLSGFVNDGLEVDISATLRDHDRFSLFFGGGTTGLDAWTGVHTFDINNTGIYDSVAKLYRNLNAINTELGANGTTNFPITLT